MSFQEFDWFTEFTKACKAATHLDDLADSFNKIPRSKINEAFAFCDTAAVLTTVYREKLLVFDLQESKGPEYLEDPVKVYRCQLCLFDILAAVFECPEKKRRRDRMVSVQKALKSWLIGPDALPSLFRTAYKNGIAMK